MERFEGGEAGIERGKAEGGSLATSSLRYGAETGACREGGAVGCGEGCFRVGGGDGRVEEGRGRGSAAGPGRGAGGEAHGGALA
eukprot:1643122-Rhodomonas_salina.1